jgi:hypothetical protein
MHVCTQIKDRLTEAGQKTELGSTEILYAYFQDWISYIRWDFCLHSVQRIQQNQNILVLLQQPDAVNPELRR